MEETSERFDWQVTNRNPDQIDVLPSKRRFAFHYNGANCLGGSSAASYCPKVWATAKFGNQLCGEVPQELSDASSDWAPSCYF